MTNKRGKGAGVEAQAAPQRFGATQVEQVPTADLIPYARNARTHSEQQVGQIAGSIQEFGFNNPVLIDGQNSIIAGHGRVLAAQRLKLETVPCIRLTHLTDAQRRAYVLADNRIALNSGWDEAMLSVELAELHADEVDLGLLGFEAGELEKLMGFELEDNKNEITEDEAPEPPVDPITKPGDLWVLGDHRLLCGDSTKAEDVERLMAGAKADLLLTDPPYGINADRQHFEGHGWVLREKTEWDKDRPDRQAIDHARSMAAEQIVWGGNYFTDYLPPSMGWLVWDKGQRDFSLADCELAWRSERKAARVFTYARAKSNREERHHPTQKPVKLMAWCIEQSEEPRTIYDPFLGSGTTLIAAEQLGRKCYGMEISPAYCDVIVKRWETLTGRKAQLETS